MFVLEANALFGLRDGNGGGRLRAIRSFAGLALLYFCADLALNKFAFSQGWTILWPLNGVTIALLIMRRRKAWPALLCAVWLGTGAGELLDGNRWQIEIALRFVSLTEVFISAWLLPSFDTLESWLRKRVIFYRFLAAILIGPGVAGVLAAVVFQFAQGQPYLVAFDNWGAADALGIATTMPLVLCLRSAGMKRLFKPQNLVRTLLTLTGAFLASTIIFSVSRYPLLFLLFPVLLLVETLLAFSGAAIAVAGVGLISVFLTINSYGPFGHWPADLPVPGGVALQIYLGFNLLALFPASVLSMERRRMSEELLRTNAQLATLASLDGLTGIANRRSLNDSFLNEWKRAIRVQSPLAFLMVDLDHFKEYNDLYGHHAGDLCLKAVADVLQAHLRRPQDVAARFGGEEFALLLPHTPLEDAQTIAERVRVAISALALPHKGSEWGNVTISVGCFAVTPVRGEEWFSLLQATDAALYEAKQAGRNCVRIGAEQTIGELQP